MNKELLICLLNKKIYCKNEERSEKKIVTIEPEVLLKKIDTEDCGNLKGVF